MIIITVSAELIKFQGSSRFARLLIIQRSLRFNVFPVPILPVDPFVLNLVSILLADADVTVTHVPEGDVVGNFGCVLVMIWSLWK